MLFRNNRLTIACVLFKITISMRPLTLRIWMPFFLHYMQLSLSLFVICINKIFIIYCKGCAYSFAIVISHWAATVILYIDCLLRTACACETKPFFTFSNHPSIVHHWNAFWHLGWKRVCARKKCECIIILTCPYLTSNYLLYKSRAGRTIRFLS